MTGLPAPASSGSAAKLAVLAREPRLSKRATQLSSLAKALASESAPRPDDADADPADPGTGIERWAGVNIFAAFLQEDAVGPAVGIRRWLNPAVDVLIQVLFFVPIVVTWLGLMLATLAYQQAVRLKSFAGKSFLEGWQSGFDGKLSGLFSLNHVALYVIVVIAVLIIAILVHFFYSGKPVEDERARLYGDLADALTEADLQLAPLRVTAPTEAATALHRATTEFAKTAESVRGVGETAGKVQREAMASLTKLTKAMADAEALSSSVHAAADGIGASSRLLDERLGDMSMTTSAIAAAQVELVRQIGLSSERLTANIDRAMGRFQDAITAKEADVAAAAESSAEKINEALAAGARQLRDALAEVSRSYSDPVTRISATLGTTEAAMSELREVISSLNTSISRLGGRVDEVAPAGGSAAWAGAGPTTGTAVELGVLSDLQIVSRELRASAEALRAAFIDRKDGRPAGRATAERPRELPLAAPTLSAAVDADEPSAMERGRWKFTMTRRRLAVIGGVLALVVLAAIAAALLTGSHPQPSRQVTTRTYVFGPELFPDGLQINRSWKLGGPGGSVLREDLIITNTTSKQLVAVLAEPVPPAIAANLHSVSFAVPPLRFLKQQSQVEWNLTLDAGRTLTLSYLARVRPLGASTVRLARWATALTAMNSQLTSRPATVQALTVAPGSVRVAVGGKYQLKLAGRLTSGGNAPATMLTAAAWRSQNPAIATVSSSGSVTGIKAGTARLTVQIGTATVSVLVTVS